MHATHAYTRTFTGLGCCCTPVAEVVVGFTTVVVRAVDCGFALLCASLSSLPASAALTLLALYNRCRTVNEKQALSPTACTARKLVKQLTLLVVATTHIGYHLTPHTVITTKVNVGIHQLISAG